MQVQKINVQSNNQQIGFQKKRLPSRFFKFMNDEDFSIVEQFFKETGGYGMELCRRRREQGFYVKFLDFKKGVHAMEYFKEKGLKSKPSDAKAYMNEGKKTKIY